MINLVPFGKEKKNSYLNTSWTCYLHKFKKQRSSSSSLMGSSLTYASSLHHFLKKFGPVVVTWSHQQAKIVFSTWDGPQNSRYFPCISASLWVLRVTYPALARALGPQKAWGFSWNRVRWRLRDWGLASSLTVKQASRLYTHKQNILKSKTIIFGKATIKLE